MPPDKGATALPRMHRIRFFSSLLFLGEVLNQLGEICRNHFACALQRGTKLKVCVSANVFDLHAGVVQRVKVYHRHISGTRDQIENPNRGRVGLIGQLEAGFVVSGIEVIVGVAHEHLIEIGRSLGVRDIGGDSRKVQTPCGGEGVVIVPFLEERGREHGPVHSVGDDFLDVVQTAPEERSRFCKEFFNASAGRPLGEQNFTAVLFGDILSDVLKDLLVRLVGEHNIVAVACVVPDDVRSAEAVVDAVHTVIGEDGAVLVAFIVPGVGGGESVAASQLQHIINGPGLVQRLFVKDFRGNGIVGIGVHAVDDVGVDINDLNAACSRYGVETACEVLVIHQADLTVHARFVVVRVGLDILAVVQVKEEAFRSQRSACKAARKNHVIRGGVAAFPKHIKRFFVGVGVVAYRVRVGSRVHELKRDVQVAFQPRVPLVGAVINDVGQRLVKGNFHRIRRPDRAGAVPDLHFSAAEVFLFQAALFESRDFGGHFLARLFALRSVCCGAGARIFGLRLGAGRKRCQQHCRKQAE